MDEQTTIIKDFNIPLGAAEIVYHPAGSTYKDMNEKSRTYGEPITRERPSLVYTHGRQRISLARIDIENFKKIINSSKVGRAYQTLPETDVLDE